MILNREAMERPSTREIDKRLKEVKKALKNRRVLFANEAKVVAELMSLEIDDTDKVWDLISELIDEIELDNYAGGYPPQKSYEPLVANCELWAFSWKSSLLKKQMYLKFCIKEETFYYVSLHKSKFPQKIEEEKNYEMFEMQQ